MSIKDCPSLWSCRAVLILPLGEYCPSYQFYTACSENTPRLLRAGARVDRDNNCLDVLGVPPPGRLSAKLQQRLYPGRVVGVVVVPPEGHHQSWTRKFEQVD